MTAEDLLRLLGRLAPHSKGANTVEVALHLRFALPLATLIGALISAPLAILFGRHGTYSAAALVVFLYYSSMQAARALGEVGYLVPLLAAWLPNGLFFLVGMVLLGRVERA